MDNAQNSLAEAFLSHSVYAIERLKEDMNHIPMCVNVPEAYILLLFDPYFSVHGIAMYSCSQRQFHSMDAFFEVCFLLVFYHFIQSSDFTWALYRPR